MQSGVDPEPFSTRLQLQLQPRACRARSEICQVHQNAQDEDAGRCDKAGDASVDPEPFFSAPTTAATPAAAGAALPAPSSAPLDPKYAKYEKMRKMKMPEGVIRQAMQRDGVDPAPFFDSGATSKRSGEASKANPAASTSPPSRPKKKNDKPKVPLRPLFWSRLKDSAVDDTFWESQSESKVNAGIDELMVRFCKTQKKKRDVLDSPEPTRDDKRKSKRVAGPVQLLDGSDVALFWLISQNPRKTSRAIDGVDAPALSECHFFQRGAYARRNPLLEEFDGSHPISGASNAPRDIFDSAL